MVKHAYGATLEVKKDLAFQKVAGITDISFPEIDVEDIEVTSHDSEGGWKEFIPGLIDGGEVSIEGNYNGDDAVMDFISAREVNEFRITTASGKTAEFKGFFNGFGVELPLDDKETQTASIKVSGKVTIGAAD